jgi:hypothetical protein
MLPMTSRSGQRTEASRTLNQSSAGLTGRRALDLDSFSVKSKLHFTPSMHLKHRPGESEGINGFEKPPAQYHEEKKMRVNFIKHTEPQSKKYSANASSGSRLPFQLSH